MNKLFTLLDNKLSLLNKDEMIIMKKIDKNNLLRNIE